MISIRKAVISDTAEMHRLINVYADEGILLHRTLQSIYEHLQCFFVAEINDQIVGTVSLHILDKGLAEVRSLVVSPDHTGKGLGRKLVNVTVQEAKKLEVPQILTLTYQSDFFKKCGFTLIEKEKLPMQKIWKDCFNCPKYNNCDETALIIDVA